MKYSWKILFAALMLAMVIGCASSDDDENSSTSINKTEVIAKLVQDMVYVEGGRFTMGGTKEQGNLPWKRELPTHQVKLSPYYIGKYPVTEELWTAVMGTNPSADSYEGGANYPVNNVSWNDCQTFINKLNAETGLTFRLPTEAEWEFAARGGINSKGYRYAGGKNIDNVGWYGENSEKKRHPVGQKQGNELGLYDMSGNVWEWCNNTAYTYPESDDYLLNPTSTDTDTAKVLRGGGYSSEGDWCRVSFRHWDNSSKSYPNVGLRLVRTDGITYLLLSRDYLIFEELGSTDNVKIAGSGSYTASSSDENIATAKISGSTMTVTAVGYGTTAITVTDKSTERTAYVEIYVNESGGGDSGDDEDPIGDKPVEGEVAD